MIKKQLTLKVAQNNVLSATYSHLVLVAFDKTDDELKESLPFISAEDLFSSICPGQFVQVRIDDSKTTFLRRPISINFVDNDKLEIHLLVRRAGDGTASLCDINPGAELNILLPLGNGFTIPDNAAEKPLLIGGGVGVAPLLYLGKKMRDNGIEPSFLLAARTGDDLLMLDAFKEIGQVYLSTDDGSEGHCGLVTCNPVLKNGLWTHFYCCGPMPMMRGIAEIAREISVTCEVSLENTMACGLGACLCCVEDTTDGHVCVCTEGPVFDISKLKW